MIHHLRRTGPVSSSAILLSATITTCGVIAAAYIQTGWLAKPSAVATVASPPFPPIARAFLTGDIEPIREETVSQVRYLAEPVERSQATEPAAIFMIAEKAPVSSAANSSATLHAPPDTKALPSPWDSLKSQPTNNQHTDSKKTAKKPFNWKSIARYFQGP